MLTLNSTSIREKILTSLLGLLLISLSLTLLPLSHAQEFKTESDVDADGNVNIRDLTLVAKHFGETVRPNQPAPNPDVDRDGNVNIRDLTLVAKYFGQTVEPAPRSNEPLKVTDATFQSLVLSAASPVVVDFGADWCPPCQWMKPIVKEVAAEYSNTFTMAKLDTDENPRTMNKYAVRSIPTYIVFRNGQILGRFVGSRPKEQFVREILAFLR